MPIFAPLFEKILKDMYAIVDIAGQQFKVEENQKVIVNRLAANEGDSVEFNKVLLKDNDGQVEVGPWSCERRQGNHLQEEEKERLSEAHGFPGFFDPNPD